MRRMTLGILSVRLVVLCLTGVCLMTGCGGSSHSSANDGATIVENGVVKHLTFEGGFYGIVGDSGQNYDPTNLDVNFQQDGLRVKFRAKLDTNYVGHLYGKGIDIILIDKL